MLQHAASPHSAAPLHAYKGRPKPIEPASPPPAKSAPRPAEPPPSPAKPAESPKPEK